MGFPGLVAASWGAVIRFRRSWGLSGDGVGVLGAMCVRLLVELYTVGGRTRKRRVL